ncbi:MAG: glycosyltransferase [Spirochaetaceae bacterium]|nr:MAG: glycosyltransferase [Spirochaetaceae bacterium]
MRGKICFSTTEYPPDIGGGSKSAGRIVSMLAREGFEVHVFAPIKVDVLPSQTHTVTEENNVRVYRVYIEKRTNHIKQFYNVIKKIDSDVKFDLFHGFFLHMAYPCILVSRQRPVIASFRGIDAIWMSGTEYRMIATEVLKKASWITSVSGVSLKKADVIVPIAHKSSFISNSIAGAFDGEWRLFAKNRRIVGTAANFRVKKNIPLLVSAYSDVDKTLRNRLLLVGDFVDYNAIETGRKNEFLALLQELSISDECLITGYMDNNKVAEYLKSMHVFVLSSDHEGLPNSIIEAATLGVPIVSTAVDGVLDIMEDGKTGLLVPPGDRAALGRAIARVLSDDELAMKLSAGARQMAEALSPEKEQKAWVSLYDKLLDGNQLEGQADQADVPARYLTARSKTSAL